MACLGFFSFPFSRFLISFAVFFPKLLTTCKQKICPHTCPLRHCSAHTPHWGVLGKNKGKLVCSNALLFWVCKSPLWRDLAWNLFRIAAKYTEEICIHKANYVYSLTSKWSVLLLCNPIISLLYIDGVGSWLKYGAGAAGLVQSEGMLLLYILTLSKQFNT